MNIKLKAGKKYSICSCGLSGSLPFCDNTHREFNASNGVEYKSVKITSEKDTIIELTSSRWRSIEESK